MSSAPHRPPPRPSRLTALVLALAWAAAAVAAPLRIGVENNSAPISFLDPQGHPVGYTAEFLGAVAKAGGIEFELVPGSWRELTEKFGRRELDALANVMATPERRAQMEFTISHAFHHAVVYFMPGSPRFRHSSDLRGRKLALLSGSIAQTQAAAAGGWGARIEIFTSWQEALQSVREGRNDAALLIRSLRAEMQQSYREFETEFIEDIIFTFRIAVQKGDLPNLARLNDAIADVRSRGEFDRIYARWIGPLEPHPIRLADLRPYYLPAGLVLAALAALFGWQRAASARLRRDVAARQQAEAEIARKEQELRFIFEGVPIGITWRLVHADGTTAVRVNDAFVRLCGLTRAQAEHPGALAGLTPVEDQVREREQEARLARGEISGYTLEKRIRRPDGALGWVVLTVVRQPAGDSWQEVSAVVEISAQKHQAEELRLAKEAAEAANRAKSQFLAMISHEIRTPMNGVIGMTALLRDSSLNETQRDYVETIRESGDSLLAIINEILDFSKIESGRLELERTSFPLHDVIEGGLDLFAPRCEEKGIELLYEAGPGVPDQVRGDPNRLRQILVNLLSNAVKFTSRGEIFLQAGAEALPGGRVRLALSVRDTGIGIAPDALARLFQPFAQVDPATSRRYGGTGLGLAISHRLAALMGGQLDVTSEAGEGSCFRLSVVLEPADAPPAPADPSTRPPLAGRRALVVDEHPLRRRILVDLLRASALEVDFARSRFEAVSRIREGDPVDVVIVHHRLPDGSGADLAAALRREAAHARIPVVQVVPVGHPEPPAGGTFITQLAKPVKPAAARTAVRVALGASAAAAPAAPGPRPPPAPQRQRVLLVEDNPVNQKVALGLLAKLGHRADVAGHGGEALDALQRQPYDIVLMDLQMPEMDGFEATRRIIAQAPSPASRPWIVAVTANALTGDRERCLAAGMDDYVAKPLTPERLGEAMARARAAVASRTTLTLRA